MSLICRIRHVRRDGRRRGVTFAERVCCHDPFVAGGLSEVGVRYRCDSGEFAEVALDRLDVGEVLSGANSDAGDAAVIAKYLRLRAHRLRPATPYSTQTKALRTVVRTRDDIVQMRVAATNQLAALLDAHWPGAKERSSPTSSRRSRWHS